jgi:protein TonB
MEEPAEARQDAVEIPQVIPVVAAAESVDVAFPVPVLGTVALAPAASLAMPPPVAASVADPVPAAEFNPAAQDAGSYPPPRYPGSALRNRYKGTVQIYISVGGNGKIQELKVHKSSGYSVLDAAALEVVKTRWRFPAGEPRRLIWPCVFQLQ